MAEIDYEPVEQPKRTNWIVVVVLTLIVGLVVSSIFVYRPGHRRELVGQLHCASNLRQIGQAFLLYAQENGGQYPPDLQTLFAAEQLAALTAVCPQDVSVKGPLPALAGRFLNCSYVYVGAGIEGQDDPDRIVVIEDPANHNFEYCNILYADGHVDSVGIGMAMQVLNDLTAGRNPPSQTTGFASSTAEQDYEKNWRARMPQMKMGVWHPPTTLPAALLSSERGQ